MFKIIKEYFGNKRSELRQKSVEHAHLLSRKSNDYSEIDEIVGDFRENGGLKHSFQSYKLLALKNFLKENNIRSVLEFGSGTSSVIFSNWIRSVSGDYVSIDEDAKWAENTKSLIKYNGEENIKVINIPKVLKESSGLKESKYEDTIQGDYDLVFIDGPSLIDSNGNKDKDLVNTNIFDLNKLPKFILVDIRKKTCDEINKRLGSKYRYQPSDLFSNGTVKEGYRYFSIFELH